MCTLNVHNDLHSVSYISKKKKKVLSALATQMQKAENGIIDSTGAPK